MVSRYDILGRRVRSTRKPIVARTAPAVERPTGYIRPPHIETTVRDKTKKEYGECINKCVTSQRECRTDARKAYQAAAKECADNRKDCVTTCKKPVFQTKEE